LLRVALEHGQATCAASTTSWTLALSGLGTWMRIATAMPQPGLPWAKGSKLTSASIDVSAGSAIFLWPAISFIAPRKHAE
jgi:hypothetical protein